MGTFGKTKAGHPRPLGNEERLPGGEDPPMSVKR